MKSTFAAVASAAIILSAADAQTYYSAPSSTPIATDCPAPLYDKYVSFKNANGKLIVRFDASVSCPAVVAAESKYTALTTADAEVCFAGNAANLGASQTLCPAPYGTKCTGAVAFCQTDDLVGAACTEEVKGEKYCLWPQPTKTLQSYARFPSNRYDYAAPAQIQQTLGVALATKCPSYFTARSPYTYTSDGGNGVVLGFPIKVGATCDAAAVAAAVQATVDELNKDPENPVYPVIEGSYTEVNAQTACWDRVTGSFHCAADKIEGCTYPCADGSICEKDSECGVKCKAIPDEGKKCVGAGITAAALPAIVAAAALAMFF